jgi:hypothetical protein
MEYACGLAGLTLVTAYPAYQVAKLRSVLEHSQSFTVSHTSGFRGNYMAEFAIESTKGLESLREIVDLEDHADRGRGGLSGQAV